VGRTRRDRVVVVTGAGSGIGRATARAFAALGGRVHLTDLDGAAVERAADEIRALGGTATAHVVDSADGPAVEALAAEVLESDGRVDVLHNNAGVCVGGPVEEISLDDWRWSVDVNLWGVVHGIRAFLPGMIRQGRGHIVNTASMAGLVGLPMVAPYCATKFAVVGLSEALATELGTHGIRVTAICPGAVRTNVMKNARLNLPGASGGTLRRALEAHATRPEVIARLVVRAVERDKSLVVHGPEMMPLVLLKGISTAAYLRAARLATTIIRKRRGSR